MTIKPDPYPQLANAIQALLKNKGQIPVIILGSSVNGLSFARSLGRRGVPCLMLDNQELLGCYTRYARFIKLPSVEAHPGVWLEVLSALAAQLNSKPVIFPTTDPHCLFIAQQAHRLASHFEFLVPGAASLEQILNKRTQYTLAQAAGIPIPKTHYPETLEQVRELSQTLIYPSLLKPYTAHMGRRAISDQKVQIVHSSAELISAFERVHTDDTPFLIQEIIPGHENALYGYLAFWDADGNEAAWLTKQKLRQNPPGYGDGSFQVTVNAPQVAELSRQLLRAFNYQGFVGIEFKFDARDSTYRLIEVNPRTVSGNQLAIEAGIDFPWIGYQYLTGGRTLPVSLFQPGLKLVNEEWDLQAFISLRKTGGLTFWRWLQSLWGAKFTIAAWDDPLPLIVGVGRLVRYMITKRK